MREIEFRGKDSTGIMNHDWFYGSLDTSFNVDFPRIVCKDKWGNTMLITVDGETVGQFTGLCDKNGKKIYEGDILCMTFSNEWTHNEERKVYYYVKFTDGMFATFYKDYENGQWEDIEDNRLDKALIEVDKLEIVGNIYDNPELLGDSDDTHK